MHGPRRPLPFVARLSTVALIFGGLLLGCDGFGTEDDPPAESPRPLTTKEQKVVTDDNSFGLKLLRATVEGEAAEAAPPNNVFLSPLSVSMALGMTLNGARGETRTAMERALEKQDLSPPEINDAYRSLIDLLEGLDPDVEVSIANSIWYRETLPVRQAFIDTNETHFDAEVTGLDFSDPNASTRINNWVRERTGGKIAEIVPESIPPQLVMYLINATYFKAPWRTKFDPDNTAEAPFHRADGSTVSVPMMRRTENVNLPYHRTDQFTAVDIPYSDSLFSMTILLPHDTSSVQKVVADLDAETWRWVTDQLRTRALGRLVMPKFTLRYGKELTDVLRSLGMGVAFTEQANFRGIADTSLFISSVKHKTFLEVNEEGTEASAATSVGVSVTSAPPSVVVDRPFVVALRERHSGTILFLGTVMDPSG